uniref:Rab-GAP TBC domain-containing protein n=1 Tax=Peronospora matthiolae TaxID=2874970 RepID=A0AAV1V4N2_9STRA
MLHELRTTFGRLTPIGGVRETAEEGRRQKPSDEFAFRLKTAVWHFRNHEKALRRLERKMDEMLDRFQVAFASLTTVAETFFETCSANEETWCGGDFKSALKEIDQEDVTNMEQTFRYTVMNPLRARLEQYDRIKKDIDVWEKLAAESKTLRALTLKMHSQRLEDHEKQVLAEGDIHKVAALLQEAERTLLPHLEDANQSATVHAADLFSTMRLQCAIFFRTADQLVQSSLSPSEQEVVSDGNRTFPLSATMRYNASTASLSSKFSKMSCSASDGWTEVDGSSSSNALDGVEAISGSDEDDESDALSLSAEDYEIGNVSRTAAAGVPVDRFVDPSKLLTLASCAGVIDFDKGVRGPNIDDGRSGRIRRLTSPSPRAVSLKPRTPRRASSMLSTIRKTIQDKLSYASGETRVIRQSSAPTVETSARTGRSVVTSSRKSGEQLLVIPQSPPDWLAVEYCLWEIDVRGSKCVGKSILQADAISDGASDVLSRLLRKGESLCFECLSYLRVEDLAQLSKVNFRLHSRLVDCAPIWKRCIRSGGISPDTRSSLWLSVFYGPTPWRCRRLATYYLSAGRRCSTYEQLLRKVDAKLGVGLPKSQDDTQLAVWFREIDVDVVRTCHRSNDANVTLRPVPVMAIAAVDKDEEDMIESVLNDMVNSIVRIEERGTSPIVDPHAGSRECGKSADARKSDLETKMRRVLRAYAVYNPRVGYCQGMGFLVRLLAEVADDEADIFWLFVGFSEPENSQNLYEPGMIVLQPYLSKFELLFSTHMPKLYSHFMAEGVHVATFCTRWFLTFFSSFETLAPTLVIRLLDIFIIDGWRIMFSVSLVILDELQQQLLQHDMEGILRILQFPRSFMPEVDESRQQQLVRRALAFSMSRTINSA